MLLIGLYISMMDAFQPRVPIYVRWTWQEKNMKPMYLGGGAKEYYADPPKEERAPNIQVTSMNNE